jgi:hypothetical protein
MYQDKIEKEARKAISQGNVQARYSNIFEKSKLLPMSFEPDEDVCDATHIARDILVKRSDKEIIELSKAIGSMLRIGENLLQSLSMKLLDTSSTRKSVVLSEGRSLYLLSDYFDLSGLQIKKVQWGELFATLTLMQSAEIIHAPSEIESYDESLREYFKQTVQSTIAQLKEEIIDSVARAECYFDIKAKSMSDGKTGGRKRADNMEPLRNEVGRRFLQKYTMYKINRAALIIKVDLINENTSLFEEDKKPNIERTFAKWINGLLNKEWQLPVR